MADYDESRLTVVDHPLVQHKLHILRDKTTTTVVRPGESLWEIAAASGTSDVSAMVTRIVELNDLESATVCEGAAQKVHERPHKACAGD